MVAHVVGLMTSRQQALFFGGDFSVFFASLYYKNTTISFFGNGGSRHPPSAARRGYVRHGLKMYKSPAACLQHISAATLAAYWQHILQHVGTYRIYL
jgi:mRNA deadenylase 3'-5' endonuclease subunit Ccr4